MSLPTAQTVVNWYSYGQSEKPYNLLDDNLIRAADEVVTISQDVASFMAGPGRLALGAAFPVVSTFFQDTDLPHGP